MKQAKAFKIGSSGVDHLKCRTVFFNKDSQQDSFLVKTEQQIRKPEKIPVSKYQKR
jgi:hypothetical protein